MDRRDVLESAVEVARKYGFIDLVEDFEAMLEKEKGNAKARKLADIWYRLENMRVEVRKMADELGEIGFDSAAMSFRNLSRFGEDVTGIQDAQEAIEGLQCEVSDEYGV